MSRGSGSVSEVCAGVHLVLGDVIMGDDDSIVVVPLADAAKAA